MKAKRDLEELARGLVEVQIDAESDVATSDPIQSEGASTRPISGAVSNSIEHTIPESLLSSRRRVVEGSDGWERTKRISLTCRQVLKVRKGIRIG